ncbi:hypothetical protein D3C87_1913910 [compost metagenome]
MCRSVMAIAASKALWSGDRKNGAWVMWRSMASLKSSVPSATTWRRSRRVKMPSGAFCSSTMTMLPTCWSCISVTAARNGVAGLQVTG